MRLDDFVMLGTTVPEITSDGRETVCSAGYSEEYGSLLRLYPLSRFYAPRRWHTYRVEIERNSRDRRMESFALRGERRVDHEGINRRSFIEQGRIERSSIADVVERHSVESIEEANQKRLSLAFMKPERISLDFDYNPAAPDAPQLHLFAGDEPVATGSKRFAYIPRLQFWDPEGFHNLQLREWGSFEFLRKNPEDLGGLKQNLKLNDDPVLLLGNHAQHRTSWLVIALLHCCFVPQLSLNHMEEVAA